MYCYVFVGNTILWQRWCGRFILGELIVQNITFCLIDYLSLIVLPLIFFAKKYIDFAKNFAMTFEMTPP